MRAYTLEELRPEFEAYLAWVRSLSELPAAQAGMPVSKWYRAKGVEVYTRHGRAVVGSTVRHTLCLANVEVSERRRGRGWFGHLIAYLQEQAPALGYQALKAECVNNPRLLTWLLSRGFEPVGLGEPIFGGSFAVELTRASDPERNRHLRA